MRIIQPGKGARRNLLVGFYCQASIHEFATTLGPSTCVLSVDTTREPMTRKSLAEKVRLLGADELGQVAIVGWSAGCHGARDVLSSVMPEIVIALDGTHGSIPQPGGMPLAPWRELVAMARRGEVLFIASHIYNTYVEQLRPPDGPYLSTVTALRELTGWPLPEPESDAPAVRRDAGLVVYSWRSSSCDAPAHARQIQHAGPLIVRDWLAPRWLGDDAPAVSPETLAALLASAQDAPPDTDRTPVTRREGSAPPPPPPGPSHGWRCGVAELVADSAKLGRWRPAAEVRAGRYTIKAGDLIVSTRPGGKHVERVVGVGPGKPTTLGGNESNTWICDSYDLGALAFEGAIEVDAEHGRLAVEVALEEFHAGVKETPGPNATPRIQEYHAGARRGGSPLAGMPGHEGEGVSTLGSSASDELAWCASSASWCAYHAEKRRAS